MAFRRSARMALTTSGLATALVSILFGAVASCSSTDDVQGGAPEADAKADAPDAPNGDADVEPRRDAGRVDVARLPVECASAPCAIALTTTFGGGYTDDGQGFCALLEDGTVACWGGNRSGQLGRGVTTIDRSSTPARVSGLKDVVSLDHTCAIDKDGATWCWGTGPFLRNATTQPSTEQTPVKLAVPPATHVGFGGRVACVSTQEGLLCWGSNESGQIGPFDTMPRSSSYGPTKIDLPQGGPIRQIAIGGATVVLREDGTALSFGANPPLGRVSSMSPDPYPASLAVDGFFAIDLVGDNACATAGGTGYCWGATKPGTVDKLNRAYPKALVIPEPVVEIATTPSASNVGDIVVPYRWCAAAVSGAVYCWGFNDNGQAGTGTKDYVDDATRVVGLAERAVSVRTTRGTSCALLTNGKVYCWGSNVDGQLGNGKNKGVALVPEEVVLP